MAKPFHKRQLGPRSSENPNLHPPVTEGHRTSFSFAVEELDQRLYKRREVQAVDTLSEAKRIKIKDERDSSSAGCNECQKSGSADKCGQHRLTNGRDMTEIKPTPSYAIQSFPDAVQLCHSSIPGTGYGVCAKQDIPVGTWIGPYEGRRVRPDDVMSETDTSYMWEIFQNGRLLYYLDAIDENTSSWMRFIRCARCVEEQNMYCFQYCGNIYYRAFKHIPIGTELLVWYDESYLLYFGIPLSIQDLNENGNKMLAVPLQAACQPSAHNVSRHPVVTSATPNDVVYHNSYSGVSRETAYSQGPGTELQNKASHPPIPHQPAEKIQQLCVRQVSPRGSPLNVPSQHPSLHYSRAPGTLAQTSFQGDTHLAEPSSSASATSSEMPVLSHVDSPRMRRASPVRSPLGVGRRRSSTQNSDASASSAPRNRHLAAPAEWSQQVKEEKLEFEDGVWKCGQCDKSFPQRVLLQMHVCCRMPNKPYQCGHCCQSFNHPNELRTHAVVHSGKKPFKCGYCARTFAGATTLNNHVRTHTGERPFTCDKCNKTFSQATQLSRHKKCLYECAEN